MRILVTGGAGYIGSHTSIVLLEQGHDVVIVDNLCNSKRVAVDRVEELSGKQVTFYQYDVCDEAKMREVFSKESIDAVIHFAGLKAVGRVRGHPPAVLRQQPHLHLGAAQGDEGVRRGELCVQLLRNGVRRPCLCAHPGGFPPLHHQPLWHHPS